MNFVPSLSHSNGPTQLLIKSNLSSSGRSQGFRLKSRTGHGKLKVYLGAFFQTTVGCNDLEVEPSGFSQDLDLVPAILPIAAPTLRVLYVYA